MSLKKVLVCIDGSNFSKAVCDYGVFIAKSLNLPLVLLNAVEHSNKPQKTDLSGSIGFGAREDLLDELSIAQMQESRQAIIKGRATLEEYGEYVKNSGCSNYYTLQRHGSLEDTLKELSSEITLAIIGLQGQDSIDKKIGSHVQELVRTLSIPILLINNEFKQVESVLVAYDGSSAAKKALQVATKNPIFPNVKRYIANVNQDINISKKLLNEAQELFKQQGIDAQTHTLSGDPAKELIKFQEKNDIDIIAMGAYGHNRLKSIIFGSFTTQMFLQAKRPLLLFR